MLAVIAMTGKFTCLDTQMFPTVELHKSEFLTSTIQCVQIHLILNQIWPNLYADNLATLVDFIKQACENILALSSNYD